MDNVSTAAAIPACLRNVLAASISEVLDLIVVMFYKLKPNMKVNIGFNKLSSFLFFVVILSSCLNRYEKEVIGYYQVDEYKLIDSVKSLPISLPKLVLRNDKTYSFEFQDSIVKGKWSADDSGDWTLIKLYYKDREISGQIGIDQISIPNPAWLDCPFLETMKFKRKIFMN